MKINERKKLVRAIRLTWSSLKSHLVYSEKQPRKARAIGRRKFHAKCVREYAEVIKTLAKQL